MDSQNTQLVQFVPVNIHGEVNPQAYYFFKEIQKLRKVADNFKDYGLKEYMFSSEIPAYLIAMEDKLAGFIARSI